MKNLHRKETHTQKVTASLRNFKSEFQEMSPITVAKCTLSQIIAEIQLEMVYKKNCSLICSNEINNRRNPNTEKTNYLHAYETTESFYIITKNID